MKDNTNQANLSSNKAVPLPADIALGLIPRIKEPRLVGDWILWLEQRPNEAGRTTVLVRPWHLKESLPQELTPSPINLRTKVHEYGGGSLAALAEDNLLILVWIDFKDGCLWQQSFEGISKKLNNINCALNPLSTPKRISRPGNNSFADGFIDLNRNRWLGVMEKDGKDFLVTFVLDKEDQAPNIIYKPKDFVGYSVLSPNGNYLAWVEWQQPNMPWDASQLWIGTFNKSGKLIDILLIAGSFGANKKQISIYQPFWLPSGELVVTEDSHGWWNLMITGPLFIKGKLPIWRHPWPMEAETGLPQWVYGMRTNSAAKNKILSAICKNGIWSLVFLDLDGSISDLNQPFDDLSDLYVKGDRAVLVASNSSSEKGILEIDLKEISWHHKPLVNSVFHNTKISIGESFWFKGYKDRPTHAWYYPPNHEQDGPSPLLVKSHSGPTSMASRGLNRGIQFWTSRGWGVVDVNYGGSTGFGRLYRQRLKHNWGVVDVYDCSAAANALVEIGKADKSRIAIEGGSAGGFTTLACLCFSEIFKVAACRYAVSDLESLVKETHRFEQGYLNSLIGSLQKDNQIYKERSPINNVNKINCPVIFFQGLKDKVVLPSQTYEMVDQMVENNINVEVHTFPEEGHGFHDSSVRIKVLEATEKFFSKYINY